MYSWLGTHLLSGTGVKHWNLNMYWMKDEPGFVMWGILVVRMVVEKSTSGKREH